MLSGVANLLFGTSSTEPEPEIKEVDVPTREGEQGWVVVDLPSSEKSSHEVGSEQRQQEEEHGVTCPPSPHQCRLRVPVEIPEGDSSCPSDPESTGSQAVPSVDCICFSSNTESNVLGYRNSSRVESWVLTPPPCFTGRRKKNTDVSDSPMENLLIEHPSMSVYNSYGGDSTGEQSNQSESSSDVEMEERPVARRTRQQVAHHAPRRPHAVAARAGIVARIENVKYAQRKQQSQNLKKCNKKNLTRGNRVHEFQALGKHQRQRNRILRPSGQMNGRVSQRKL